MCVFFVLSPVCLSIIMLCVSRGVYVRNLDRDLKAVSTSVRATQELYECVKGPKGKRDEAKMDLRIHHHFVLLVIVLMAVLFGTVTVLVTVELP